MRICIRLRASVVKINMGKDKCCLHSVLRTPGLKTEIGHGQRNLETIPGLPPSLDKIPGGCAFASRCNRVVEACHATNVQLMATHRKTLVRCIEVDVTN